jgi:PAS domain S-box-containing protein
VLVSWGLDNAVLKSVFPGAVTMKANTALAFVLAGMSLWMLGTDQASLRRRRIAVACAALVALIGSLTFAEYLFGWNLGIDQLLFQESSDAAGTSHPGRMAPTTALNFIMIGAALALLDAARGFRAVQLLVVLAGFIGLLGVIGYLYRVKDFYRIAFYTEMALHTAAAFIVLSVSILCARPDRGLMAIAASDTAGGIMTRRLLPFVIGVPFVLGWAKLTAERAGFFSTKFGLALFAVSLVVLFTSLIMWLAGLLHRIDMERSRAEVRVRKHEAELCNAHAKLEQRVEERTAELRLAIEKLKQEIADRKRAEETLRESQERFRLIMEHANDAIVYLDLAGIVRWANHQAVVISGRSMEEMVGRSFMIVLAPEAAARAEARLDAIRRGEFVPSLVEFEVLRPDGSVVRVEANFTSVLEDGTVVGRLLVSRDITERKRAEAALRESEQRLSQLLEDRERISRDLHDNIIQMLYAIGLGLEESQRLFGEDSKTASSNLSNAIKELNAVIRDVRSYIAWSEPKVSDGRQLKAAIERLARTMEGTHLLHFRLKVDQAAADRLAPEEASHVLYIAREAMSNSLRHSEARSGLVSLQRRDGHVRLQVEDDGVGFDPKDVKKTSQGLRNIAARAKELGAKLEIVSEPAWGVRIVLDIPKEKKHASA